MSDEPIGVKSHHEEQGLEALYRDVIFEHYRRPANKGVLDGAQIVTKGNNPVCGDRVTIYGKVENGKLAAVSFEGKACAICMASIATISKR
jgi:nitrogen fixation protein NifU and related proteins